MKKTFEKNKCMQLFVSWNNIPRVLVRGGRLQAGTDANLTSFSILVKNTPEKCLQEASSVQ